MRKTSLIKIRLAKAADIVKIYDLSKGVREVSGTSNAEYSAEVVFYYKDEIAEMIGDRKNNIWLVAETGKGEKMEIIGFLFAKIMSSDWCYLDSVGVKKNFGMEGSAPVFTASW
jgi:hypothetical protein